MAKKAARKARPAVAEANGEAGGTTALDDGPAGVRYVTVGWRDAHAHALTSARCESARATVGPPSCVRIPFREAEVNADER